MKTETILLIIAVTALYLQYKQSQQSQVSGNVVLGPVQSITPVDFVSY